MIKMKKIRFLSIAILTSLMVCVLISCDKDDTPVVDTDNPFRVLLASMDWGRDTCYVYGHKIPDTDAVCSSLAYAKLMRTLGYNCVAKISSSPNKETKYICDYLEIDMPVVKSSVTQGTRLIATDHEEYIQSVDGARDARILQIIDHHQEGDMATSQVPFVYRELVGSTCTLVWQLYQEADVPVDEATARILFAGLVSDTSNLARSNTTKEDSLAWYALTSQLHVEADSVAIIYRNMQDELSDYDGMSDYDIFVSDYKDYDMGGVPVGIGCVEWTDYASMDEIIDRLLAVMPQVMEDKNRKMVFCMATRYAPNPDTESEEKVIPLGTYIMYYGDGAREVAEEAIGPSLREGVCYSETRLSRRSTVVPLFTEILSRQ